MDKYQILATLDTHTSSICRHLDKKIIDRKDFKPGVTSPPFHPHCRSTMIPFVGELMGRSARIDGKSQYIDDMTYEEWHKEYVK